MTTCLFLNILKTHTHTHSGLQDQQYKCLGKDQNIHSHLQCNQSKRWARSSRDSWSRCKKINTEDVCQSWFVCWLHKDCLWSNCWLPGISWHHWVKGTRSGAASQSDLNGGLPGAQTDTDDVRPRFPRTAGARQPPAAAFVYIFPRGACRHFLVSLKEVSRAQSRLMSLEMRPLISFQVGMIIDHLPQLAPTGEQKGGLEKSKQVKLK